MQEADRQYFEAMEGLFTSPGWKVFNDDITGWQEAISSQWRTMKPEDLRYAQGRFDALDQILTHFKSCEAWKTQALEDDLDVPTI